jgi:hypothetical protein
MVRATVACLPTAVSLLLLAALFMQISGVSLTLTWPCRLCLLRVFLWHEPLLQAFPFPSTLGVVTLHSLSQPCVFVYSSHGKWVFPPSHGVFLPRPLLQVFPLLITGQCCCSCQPACLFTAHMGGGSSPLSCGVFFPPPTLTSYPAPGCWARAPAPAGPACLFTVPGRVPFPQSSAFSEGVPHPLSHMSLLFLLLITQFLFFPQVSRGLR